MIQSTHDLAHDLERVLVALREMIRDAARRAVDVRAAKLLGRDILARRRLHQRRTAEKIVPWPFTMTVSSLIAGT